MGTTALRQLLKSLCSNSHWKYAVLWKLSHGSPMILTWEDGYFDYPKPRQLGESLSDDAYLNGANDILPLQFGTTYTMNGCCWGHPIGPVVADMSSLQYTLGEGVVGKVAFTGNHCWISFSDIFAGDFNPEFDPGCPEEWLLQFALGIKTILLVPVLPYGVLQLGSLVEVAENVEIITHVKDRFNSLDNVGGDTVPFTLKRDFQAQLSYSLKSNPLEHLKTPSDAAIRLVKSEDLNHSITINSFKVDKDNLPAVGQILPSLTVEDAFMSSGENVSETFDYETKIKVDAPLIDLVEVSRVSESINASELETVESKLFELSCLVEELQAYSECNDYKAGVFGEFFNGIKNSCSAGHMAGEPSRGKAVADMDHGNASSFLNFPKDCELHQALGPGFWRQTYGKLWDSPFLGDNTCCSSSLVCNKDLSDRAESSCLAREDNAEYLLDAVVGNAYSGSDDYTFNRSNCFKSPAVSSGLFASSYQSQNNSETNPLVGNDSVTWSHNTSVCDNGNANITSAALKSMLSTAFDNGSQERKNSLIKQWKGHKTSNVSKRGTRQGDNQRPRPRDRQLIQDRLKELRELVPNGAKCSIDGLLDRTIKHMMYLQSVTERAEKSMHWSHQEVVAHKNRRSSETKDACQNGRSWAYELGSELQLCPIVVEDLAYPGHMLIEMLCNEHGLFLEIAQVIRGLELTILKGVMEYRSNNTWAHFIVEASEGFHRLDIFWPLMQLLQRKRNSISSKI